MSSLAPTAAEKAASEACNLPRSADSAAVEYARNLWAMVLYWYGNADGKAQVLLVLDGVLLSFLTGSIFAKSELLVQITRVFGPETWVLFALMSLSLTASILSALACLWSRIYRPAELDSILRQAGVQRDRAETYTPEVMYYFQLIAGLDDKRFQERLALVTREFEIEALASQIAVVSRNVTFKHSWVNRGFLFVSASLILLLAGCVSFLVRWVSVGGYAATA